MKKTSAAELFSKGKFLSREAMKRPKFLTIADYDPPSSKAFHKPVIHWEEEVKPLSCNITNWNFLIDYLGDDPDDWAGNKVEVYDDPAVEYGGKKTGGLRLREPSNDRRSREKKRHHQEPVDDSDDDDLDDDVVD